MINLSDAIEMATNIAYEEDASQYVVNDDYYGWRIIHEEDPEAFAPGTEPRFLVHSYGVDSGHIYRGEITKDWKLP